LNKEKLLTEKLQIFQTILSTPILLAIAQSTGAIYPYSSTITLVPM